MIIYMATEFEEKIKKIFDYVAEFGIRRMPIHLLRREPNDSEKARFKALVHFGFRLGQKMLVEEILKLLELKSTTKAAIKKASKAKDKELKQFLLETLAESEMMIQILRHFADFIAWQIIGGHYFKARAFYSGQRTRPDLANTNLITVLETVDQLYLKSPRSFCLITDLTTFIDIGDVLWADEGAVYIIEVKSGSKQRKVNDLVKKIYDLNYNLGPEDLADFTPSMMDQAERTINQQLRGERLITFLRQEGGKDPFTGEQHEVIEVPTPVEYYFNEVEAVIEKAVKDGFAHCEVEGVVNLAVYMEEFTPKIFKFSKPGYLIQDQKIIEDYRNQIFIPIREPMFFKPIGKDRIIDILLGKLKVIMIVDLDQLIEFFNAGGLKARWMSRKETFKHMAVKRPKTKTFCLGNRAIELEVDGMSIVLGDTFLIRLLFDNVKPSSLRKMYIEFIGRLASPQSREI